MTQGSDNVPRSIDAYLALVEACATIETLFELYQDEIEREGYQNVVFARVGGRNDRLEIPYGRFPRNVARTYFEERLWENDPIISASQRTARPFTWIDEMIRKTHSAAAWRVMEVKKEHGIAGGMTMPFHGPGGFWDFFSLSMRDNRLLNTHRIAAVNLKSYATLQRYLVLEGAAKQRLQGTVAPSVGPGQRIADASASSDSHPAHPQHGEGVGVIEDAECQALVLVDIAWRRYSAGLIRLNERVPDLVGEAPLRSYVNRGLIEEEADDTRFRYVFKPSPIGQSHIRLCPCVPAVRNEICDSLVETNEVPQC